MKTIILKVKIPNNVDEKALTIRHHVKAYPIVCSYEVITLPTDKEIEKAFPLTHKDAKKYFEWLKSKILEP